MADKTSLRYAGYHTDGTAGGYSLGNGYRLYLPGIMRFASPDSLSPFGPGGINAYAYCRGNPIDGSDPGGHIKLVDLMEDTGETTSLLEEQALRPASRSSTRTDHGTGDRSIGMENTHRDTSPPAPLDSSRRTTRRSSDRNGTASQRGSRAGTPQAASSLPTADDTNEALLQRESFPPPPLPAAEPPLRAAQLGLPASASPPGPPSGPGPRPTPAAGELALSIEGLLSANSVPHPHASDPLAPMREAAPSPRITSMPAMLYPRARHAGPWRALFNKAVQAYDAWRHPDPWLD
ncbi:RHS repeat-associated core domain-containing protein [Bordetella bronchialis]|uniref:RHS repeat-associated core domain-containing protein n=1 Tax=Bordetella bronchialis TaxID=463025 RepID=A0ABM6CQT7_9BORD|nr:RHS repeat-associated core domain-containing protein [Bordetella bronchialis]ANN66335.1 hypothetical protein BAU06_08585 [Bordetella bronchialis]